MQFQHRRETLRDYGIDSVSYSSANWHRAIAARREREFRFENYLYISSEKSEKLHLRADCVPNYLIGPRVRLQLHRRPIKHERPCSLFQIKLAFGPN